MKNKLLICLALGLGIFTNAQVQSFNTKVRFNNVTQNNVSQKVAMLAEDGTLVFMPKDSIASKIDDTNFLKKREPNDAGFNFSLFTQDESSLDYGMLTYQAVQFSDASVNQVGSISKEGIRASLQSDNTYQGTYLNHNVLQFSESDAEGVTTGFQVNKNGFLYSHNSQAETYNVDLPKKNEGTLILSINGSKADESGNVQLDIPELGNLITKDQANTLVKHYNITPIDNNVTIPLDGVPRNQIEYKILFDGVDIGNVNLPNGGVAYNENYDEATNTLRVLLTRVVYTRHMNIQIITYRTLP